ncbi:MAG: enoyl-CoA hydratase/isomerase family protein [Planctomycetes bacterium]|nr:enoyl-CoA hydratase/isomerase family protein [Planctomycetota bacterium]
MATEPVRLEIEGRVARITIDRPDARNALSGETVRGLGRAFARVDASKGVRVVILGSAGDAAFCAGGDLAEMSGLEPSAGLPGAGLYAELLKGMRRLAQVVVARVQGPAVGGGLGLVLAADLAVASTRARFGTPEAGVGLFPMMVLAPLARHLPPKILGRLVFAGEPLTAEEAGRWGLVNEVVQPDGLEGAVETLVAKVLRSGPEALSQGRRALAAAEEMPYDQALDFLRHELERLWVGPEAREGIRAFLEKRRPSWQEGG